MTAHTSSDEYELRSRNAGPASDAPLQITELPGGQPAPRTAFTATRGALATPSIHDPEVMARSDDENPKAEVLKKPATPLSALALFNASRLPMEAHTCPSVSVLCREPPLGVNESLALIGG